MINTILLKELYNQGLYDSQIASKLGCTPSNIIYLRKKLKLESNFKRRNYPTITDEQRSIIIGSVMGDAGLYMQKTSISPEFMCQHGPTQLEYNEWKMEKLKSLNCYLRSFKRKTVNKKTGKLYEFNLLRTKVNKNLLPLYNAFYKNGKKIITNEILEHYDELSLAVHFMDDGHKDVDTYGIATCGFDYDSLLIFKNFLERRFKIESTIQKDNRIRIRNSSTKIMTSIIEKYVNQIECMKYKLLI